MPRTLWTIVAFVLIVGLIAKFSLATLLADSPVAMLLPILGVLFCLYLIFMLEGLQVAGIKDLDSDAIDLYLTENSNVGREKVMPVYETFSKNFFALVIGRQVFIIMTVISLATLIGKVVLNTNNISSDSGLSFVTPLVEIIDHKYFSSGASPTSGISIDNVFSFAASTLIPAWMSQLLSQFLADKSAINFIGIPGARLVLSLAMFLDKIKIGEPALVMMKWIEGKDATTETEHIPLGKLAFYDASVNFYGRAKEQHNIQIDLDTVSTIKEQVTYVFKRGRTDHINHAIHLREPIVGDLKGHIDLPESVVAEFIAHDSETENGYLYWIRINFNQPLPLPSHEYDEISLTIQYQTKAYTTDMDSLKDNLQTLQYSTLLPTEQTTITLLGKDQLLRQPNIAIVEIEGSTSAISNETSSQWSVTSPVIGSNQSEIIIDHPTVGTTYQISFEAMDAEAEVFA